MKEILRIYEYWGMDAAIEQAKKTPGIESFIDTWAANCGASTDTFVGQLVVSIIEMNKAEK